MALSNLVITGLPPDTTNGALAAFLRCAGRVCGQRPGERGCAAATATVAASAVATAQEQLQRQM